MPSRKRQYFALPNTLSGHFKWKVIDAYGTMVAQVIDEVNARIMAQSYSALSFLYKERLFLQKMEEHGTITSEQSARLEGIREAIGTLDKKTAENAFKIVMYMD